MTTSHADGFSWSHGAVIRGRRDQKRLSLVFTGGDFGEGADRVRETLRNMSIPGSFFFTGGFLRESANQRAIEGLLEDGHYLGPHSDAHLLYCPWEDRSKTLVSREEFRADLEKNIQELIRFGVVRRDITWWIPPFEWYNEQIAAWSLEAGLRLFNFTPGTLSHTDYTEDDAPNYRDCDTIWRSIMDYEIREPDGLNGFLLLVHVGAGPGRTDKFFNRLGMLIEELGRRGYTFARVDSLLRMPD